MIRFFILLVCFSTFSPLIGCAASPPTAEQLSQADYGTPISQPEAEQQAKAWLKLHLKDPGSAQYDWGEVTKGWARHAPIDGGKLLFGYNLTAQINAKNSFGGYNGYKPYQFYFFNGQLMHVWGHQTIGSGYSQSSYMGRLK